MVNGTWQPITNGTINATACLVSFNIGVDRTVALFEPTQPATTTPTTIAQKPTSNNGAEYGIAAVSIIIIMSAIYLAVKRRRRHSTWPTYRKPLFNS